MYLLPWSRSIRAWWRLHLVYTLTPTIRRKVRRQTVRRIQYTFFFPLSWFDPFVCLSCEIFFAPEILRLSFLLTCSFKLSRKLDFFLNLSWIQFCTIAENKIQYTKISFESTYKTYILFLVTELDFFWTTKEHQCRILILVLPCWKFIEVLIKQSIKWLD